MTSFSIFSLVLMHVWPCTSIRARFPGYFHPQIAVRDRSVCLRLDWFCSQRETLRLLIPAAGGVPNSEWGDVLSIPTHPAFFTAFATGHTGNSFQLLPPWSEFQPGTRRRKAQDPVTNPGTALITENVPT